MQHGREPPIRVAFVAERMDDLSCGFAAGVCKGASPSRGMIARDFFLAGPELIRTLSDWQPNVVVCFIVDDLVINLRDQIPPEVPIVSTARVQQLSNTAVVLASAIEFYCQAHRLFDQLQVNEVWQFVFGGEPTGQSSQRQYREYAARHNVVYHSQWAPEPQTLVDLHKSVEVDPDVEFWLNQVPKPVGIFSQNTLAGCYLARTCELIGLKVPVDVAIIGSDGFQVATSTHPPVTSVLVPAPEIGLRAVDIAIEMLETGSGPCEPVIIEGLTILERASTGGGCRVDCDIDAALQFIGQHACEGVKVNDVVEQTQGVSRMTFHKRFLEVAGVTPGAAIRERRMREARWLLSQTDVAPGTICGLCGYREYPHFYKVFRASEGVSPTQYRNLVK